MTKKATFRHSVEIRAALHKAECIMSISWIHEVIDAASRIDFQPQRLSSSSAQMYNEADVTDGSPAEIGQKVN